MKDRRFKFGCVQVGFEDAKRFFRKNRTNNEPFCTSRLDFIPCLPLDCFDFSRSDDLGLEWKKPGGFECLLIVSPKVSPRSKKTAANKESINDIWWYKKSWLKARKEKHQRGFWWLQHACMLQKVAERVAGWMGKRPVWCKNWCVCVEGRSQLKGWR